MHFSISRLAVAIPLLILASCADDAHLLGVVARTRRPSSIPIVRRKVPFSTSFWRATALPGRLPDQRPVSVRARSAVRDGAARVCVLVLHRKVELLTHELRPQPEPLRRGRRGRGVGVNRVRWSIGRLHVVPQGRLLRCNQVPMGG